jgi:hypothetical protein
MISSEPQKSYRLTLEHRPSYLYAFVEADHENYEIAKQYWSEILDAADAANLARIMVQYDLKEVATMTDTFKWVSELAPNAPGARIACVDPISEHANIHKFSELVATNRGVTAKAFEHADDAEKWLLAA